VPVTTPLWRTAQVDDALAERIASRFHLPHRVAKWLCIRNIPEDRIAAWLRPESSEWLSSGVFWDMDAAVNRLLAAAEAGERVCIVGDYDVDGVTASAILATTVEALGITWRCLIPHRVEDGYGLSQRLVDQAYALGSTVLVTVDNGIRAHEAIDYAVSLGMDVVLTDHHEPGDTLPESALVTLHWARADGSEARTLSGAGVARKFADALLRRAVQSADATPLLNWHTGLAALGALADMMPMSVENRKLVKAGLSFLRQCDHPGWRALCHVARVDAQTLSETAVLWSIAPRLNAAGRMGTATVALDLLMSKTDEEAAPLAERIEAWNRERKEDTERVFQEALAQHQALDPHGTSPVIVVSGPWNLGVAGIAAARLVNATGRPALVLADDGTGLLRGSGRASDGFPLHEVVTQCKDYLVHFGGHEAAIGCAVEKEQLEQFREAVCAAAKPYDKRFGASLDDEPVADDYLPLGEVTLETLEWVERFAPHGPDNPPLTFYVGPVTVVQVTPMGGGKHARIRVREGKQECDLVWFRAPEDVVRWERGWTVAAVVSLERNTWKGRTSAQLRVTDAFVLRKPLLRQELGYLYRLLHARRKLTLQEAVSSVPERSAEEAQIALETFVELGFAERTESAYHVVEHVVPRDLRDSKHYQSHLRRSASEVRFTS
jgi:single-stranded-DNA-specific exonuclease